MNELLQKRVEEELDCTQRIVELGARLYPRFRVLTAVGDFHVILPRIVSDETEWNRLVAAYMAYKLAHAFIVSWCRGSNDAISMAVSHATVTGYKCRIDWSSRSLGPRVPVGIRDCKEDYLDMLPLARSSLDEKTYTLMLKRFGPFDPSRLAAIH